MRLAGFQFTVREGGAERLCFLQGAGGRMGDGCLYVNEDVVSRVESHLLRRARAELENEGVVREFTEHEDYRQRIKKIHPQEIVACKALFVKR